MVAKNILVAPDVHVVSEGDIGTWNLISGGNNVVSVKPGHVAGWNTGADIQHPILVKRDNPWFWGWYYSKPNTWMYAEGTYSHKFQNSWWAGVFLRTYEFGTDVKEHDDWQTPIRGDSTAGYGGWQDSNELAWFNFAVRSGNLVPDQTYALVAFNAQPAVASWYKLHPDVIVVPVVAIYYADPEAGNAFAEWRSRIRAVFDFIPFQGSKVETVPDEYEWMLSGWSPDNADDPTLYWDPPDDVWTQCGIQFQVVRVFRLAGPDGFFPAGFPGALKCDTEQTHYEFVLPAERRKRIKAAIGGTDTEIGEADTVLLVDELKPVFAEFTAVGCSNWYGKTIMDEPRTVEIDLADVAEAPTLTLAHELGHVLLGPGEEKSDETNLMYSPPKAPGLKQVGQCDEARVEARKYADRFRVYNQKIGRVPTENPYTPTYPVGEDPSPVSSGQSCCQDASGKHWSGAGLCLAAGGTILPDNKCTECCQTSQFPADAAFKPIGQCAPENVILSTECDKVCCRHDTDYVYTSHLFCSYLVAVNQGEIVDGNFCAGAPH